MELLSSASSSGGGTSSSSTSASSSEAFPTTTPTKSQQRQVITETLQQLRAQEQALRENEARRRQEQHEFTKSVVKVMHLDMRDYELIIAHAQNVTQQNEITTILSCMQALEAAYQLAKKDLAVINDKKLRHERVQMEKRRRDDALGPLRERLQQIGLSIRPSSSYRDSDKKSSPRLFRGINNLSEGTPRELMNEMAEQRALGSRWTEAELREFFTLAKAIEVSSSSSGDSGDGQWDKLGEKLPTRTPTMIRALFDQHREYLVQPETSVEGFCTVVADYYKGLGEIVDDKLVLPSGGAGVAVAAAPDANIKMEEVAGEPSSVTAEIYQSSYNGNEEHCDLDEETDVANRIRKREDSLTPSSAATASAIATAIAQVPSSSSWAGKKEKKKRKLDRVLAWDAAGDQLDKQAQLQLQIKSDDERGGSGAVPMTRPSTSARTLQRTDAAQSVIHASAKSPSSSRSRVHPRDASLSKKLRGKKFALPWYNWFYSYVDSGFFNHNEFIDCLHRMGLGKINAAARPIWSSVRASMGRPRRLSARFFVQEKAKLDNYRTIKRRIGVHKESGGSAVSCSVDSVMILDGDSLVQRENEEGQQTLAQSQQQLPNAFQHSRSAGANGSESTGSWTNGDWASTIQSQHQQQEKIRAVLAVKDLLHRKEQLVTALAKLNNRVGTEQQEASRPSRVAINQNALHVDTSSSWPVAGDRSVLQRQYAWIVVNLDVTNRSLQEALVRLQECSGNAQAPSSLGAQPSLSMPPPPSQPQAMDLDGNESSSETLTLQQMKWAVSFLAQSRKRSSDLVGASISQMAQTEGGNMLLPSSNSSMASPPPLLPLGVLPETKQLISTCLCLMSVVRSGTSLTASPGVPPLVTQKLMERLLELLMPRHDANMDLYAELLSAAEGVQTTLQSTSLS